MNLLDPYTSDSWLPSTVDLWDCLEQASGKPIAAKSYTWLFQVWKIPIYKDKINPVCEMTTNYYTAKIITILEMMFHIHKMVWRKRPTPGRPTPGRSTPGRCLSHTQSGTASSFFLQSGNVHSLMIQSGLLQPFL